MNKTPIAAGLAMIMGISVVFAFDRVKPVEGVILDAPQAIVAAAVADEPVAVTPGIEASILMDEAPLILDESQGGIVVAAADKPANRSLKDALADMQNALQLLQQEAELTHRAVAALKKQYQQ